MLVEAVEMTGPFAPAALLPIGWSRNNASAASVARAAAPISHGRVSATLKR
jgi:hypothetical protein